MYGQPGLDKYEFQVFRKPRENKEFSCQKSDWIFVYKYILSFIVAEYYNSHQTKQTPFFQWW